MYMSDGVGNGKVQKRVEDLVAWIVGAHFPFCHLLYP